MASSSTKTRILGFLLTMVGLLGISLGAVHEVGDSAGWTVGDIDYAQWASTRTFHVGDSLVFKYESIFHDVVEVIQDDFQLCRGRGRYSAIATYNSGSDSVTLERPGHYYFLCSVPGHCQAGQKLDVLVLPSSITPTPSPRPSALGLGLASPPATANPPSSSQRQTTSPLGGARPAQSAALSLISFGSKLSLPSTLVLLAFYVFGFAF